MSRLFKFDSLLTPFVIKFLFYCGVCLSVVSALGIVGSGLRLMDYQFTLGLVYIIGGVVWVGIGTIFSRVGAEIILVLFMIRDELAWQRENTQTRQSVYSMPTMAAE